MDGAVQIKSENANYQTLYGAPEGIRALEVIKRVALAPDQTLIHIALDDLSLARMGEAIRFFAPDIEVLTLPAWDCLPYDRVSPNPDIVGERVQTLSILTNQEASKPRVLLTTVNAALQKLPPCAAFKGTGLHVKKGARINGTHLAEYLTANGYYRVDTVREPAEFAIRGDIIDIYPTGEGQCYRIDLFGDEVESLRVFDPISQRTTHQAEALALTPTSEITLDESTISKFRAGYREAFGMPKDIDTLYESVKEGRVYSGMEHWLPLFYDGGLETLFDYVPKAAITLDPQFDQARDERFKQIHEFYASRVEMLKIEDKAKLSPYNPIPINSLYFTLNDWFSTTVDYDVTLFSPFNPTDNQADAGGRMGRDFGDVRATPNQDVYQAVASHINLELDTKKRVMVSGYSDGARDRLRTVLLENGIASGETAASWASVQGMKPRTVGFVTLSLEQGFETDKLVVVTEQDILGDRLARPRKKRKSATEDFLSELSQLSEGDYVVHEEHGIGKFEKLETVTVMNISHDCLKITYHGNDRLFVPVENIEVLTRYGGEDLNAVLDKLGGAGWQARKARVKKNLLVIANALLKIAAARLLKKTESIIANPIEYDKFAAGFPYIETEDQARAIDEVLGDLVKGQAMDRLVCGDVGFGKTEIALRAAFVMAMAGYQVAIVTPTTLLARQHFQEFKKRFKGFPIRVVQLSRLVKPSEAKLVKDEIRRGDANVIIGTHALLAESLRFNNLGMMIVDEEQRFGVKQKERLKEIQDNVHVLTLTATPIPRTLQMSLTGVKDLSLIATPPVDRLAVRTFVMPRDPVILREALMREQYRGGQSFYVCPRISDIAEVEKFLRELVPDLKIIVAHGQMSGEDLEDRVGAFIDGQYDILLATNIIESGIDIPNANTIVVHRAEMFGLAQLYQLRGRIGRSKLRGYAYLTFDPRKKLTKPAEQRLQVLEQLNTLGAGFQLASHDMDIRGGGNILGEEQSGHIREVGIELYHQMLEEAIAAVREGRDSVDDDKVDDEKFTPNIELGMPVMIPERYVKDINARLQLYRRLSDLVDESDIDSFAAELVDRFGELPEEVQNLLDIISIKQLCRLANIAKVEAGPKGAVLGFHNDDCPYIGELVKYMAENVGTVKLRPKDQKLVFMRVWPENRHRVKGVRMLLRTLVKMAQGLG